MRDLPSFTLMNTVVDALRKAGSRDELAQLMAAITHEMKFRYYALIHHDDLCTASPGLVDLKDYPQSIADHLFSQRQYRRDPVIRGCIFADGAFLWSELSQFMRLSRRDRESFELGAAEGLNEGITVPYVRLGHRMGSCTFAGTQVPEQAHQFLGAAQMIGIFAFQAACRMVSGARTLASSSLRLHPRPRDCVVLAGQGFSNKQIARALAITPRTVDGYLTEARRLFDAHDRTELVFSAVLAGEVGLHEISRQPE